MAGRRLTRVHHVIARQLSVDYIPVESEGGADCPKSDSDVADDVRPTLFNKSASDAVNLT